MKKIIYIFTIIFFTLTSCEKNELNTFELSQKADSKTINENIETLASLISQASENVEFRQLIKNEVGKQFDGDYDALLLTFIGKEISGEKFEEILANKSNGKLTADQIIKMIKTSGYLQISIPVLFDEFNAESTTPISVAIPVNTKVETAESFKGYNVNGNILTISAKTAPEEPVFVIMESERIDEKGNLKVNEEGLYIEKGNRIHYSKALVQNSNGQLVKSKKSKIIEVLSNEEYDALVEENRKSEMLHSKNNSKPMKTLNSTNSIGNYLTAHAKYVRTIELQWQPVEGANRFVVYRNGYKNVNGYKVYFPDLQIADLSNTYTKSDLVDYSNEEYSYYVSYYNGTTFLGQSYVVSLHSSHRKNNGIEFVQKISASKRMVEILEGWWASELEIRAQITYINSQEQQSNGGDIGFVIPTIGSGIWAKLRPVEWTGYKTLFTWDRSKYDCGSYTIVLEETDTSDDIKDKINIIVEWVHFLPDSYSSVIKEVATSVNKTIDILDKPDYIGTFSVKWWDPNDVLRNVNSNGFSIVINHDSSL